MRSLEYHYKIASKKRDSSAESNKGLSSNRSQSSETSEDNFDSVGNFRPKTQNLSISPEDKTIGTLYLDHMLQSLASVKYLKKIRMPTNENVNKSKMMLTRLGGDGEVDGKKMTVVFDLEETLVHLSDKTEKADLKLMIKKNKKKTSRGDESLNNSSNDVTLNNLSIDSERQDPSDNNILAVGVFLRPYLLETLKNLAKHFEVILFSSSSLKITNKIADFLEREAHQELFSFRLSREACYMTDSGLFIKDLRLINRNIKRMVLVDDSTYGFGFQLANGVPIIPFTGNVNDTELLLLSQYLTYLEERCSDVRTFNKDYFKLHLYESHNSIHRIYKQIF